MLAGILKVIGNIKKPCAWTQHCTEMLRGLSITDALMLIWPPSQLRWRLLDHCYYHLAFVATREIDAMEELSWDYDIDFSDGNHGKAFECHCGSESCRGSKLSKGTTCSSDFQDMEFLNGVFHQNIFPKKERSMMS